MFFLLTAMTISSGFSTDIITDEERYCDESGGTVHHYTDTFGIPVSMCTLGTEIFSVKEVWEQSQNITLRAQADELLSTFDLHNNLEWIYTDMQVNHTTIYYMLKGDGVVFMPIAGSIYLHQSFHGKRILVVNLR